MKQNTLNMNSLAKCYNCKHYFWHTNQSIPISLWLKNVKTDILDLFWHFLIKVISECFNCNTISGSPINAFRYHCFVSCGFLVHYYQTSLLTTLLPGNKNWVRILKGSYIVMKCSDNKVYETIWYLPSESARSTADKWLTLVLWHHYNVSH